MTHPNTPQCPGCGDCPPERRPVPAGSEVDGERATPAATPQAGAGMVLAEREALRAGQSAAVMPLIGPLLDAWDGMSNDARAEVLDEAPDLAKYLSRIGHAMEAAPSPTPAPAATAQVLDDLAYIERETRHLSSIPPVKFERLRAALAVQAEPQAAAERTARIVERLQEAAQLAYAQRRLPADAVFAIEEAVKLLQPAPAPAQQLSEAEAYRWLRDTNDCPLQVVDGEGNLYCGEGLDATVRAAMQQKGGAV